MRKEPFTVGSFVHVYNRGNRKQPIVCDDKDRWHFLQMLYYFNNQISPANIFRDLRDLLKSDFNRNFAWPAVWPARKPIVKILAFSLLQNHFHLLLKEIKVGGITMFMRKIGTGMTNYFNTKYKESGRLFQGAYKARVVNKDVYLKYLSVYIQVKNIFELRPGGVKKALKDFDKAFDFAVQYPYCSLAEHTGKRRYPIVDKDILKAFFPTPRDYKEFTRECLKAVNLEEEIANLIKDAH